MKMSRFREIGRFMGISVNEIYVEDNKIGRFMAVRKNSKMSRSIGIDTYMGTGASKKFFLKRCNCSIIVNRASRKMCRNIRIDR